MDFRRHKISDTPDINLIPFIDVLLVILIFLMVSTTFSKYAELQISLPTASTDNAAEHHQNLDIAIDATGQIMVNGETIKPLPPAQFAAFLRQRADRLANGNPTVIIAADGSARHQSVVSVLEAVRLAGLERLAFATVKAGKDSP